LIREIVATHGYDLYVAKINSDKCGKDAKYIYNILTPERLKSSSQVGVVLLEDFDRYLERHSSDRTSDLLNALDGIENNSNVVRFFSLNSIEHVKKNQALMSRFSRIFVFNCPDEALVKKHLIKIFPNEENAIDKFINKLQERNYIGKVSYRQINNFLSRYYLNNNVISVALDNIDNWFKELDQFTEINNKTSN